MDEDKQIELTVEETALAPAERQTDMLIKLAVDKNLDLDKLERLIELKNREDERVAKREFDEHFAAMQREFKPVARSKDGDKAKYAPIEALQKEYGPVISNHGFSYRWSEESLENDGLRVVLHISGYGHTETNHKDLPKYEPDKGAQSGKPIMNILQAEGVRQTYGRRYTFIAGFGLIIEDEDTDGNFDEGVEYADYVRKLQEEADPKKLVALGRGMYSQLKKEGDMKGAMVIQKVTTKLKEQLLK